MKRSKICNKCHEIYSTDKYDKCPMCGSNLRKIKSIYMEDGIFRGEYELTEEEQRLIFEKGLREGFVSQ